MADVSARKRIWGWFFFDWASQPYHTLLVTFVFGPFFAAVASNYFLGTGLEEEAADARVQTLWSWCLALSGLVIAFGAPIMGAMADSAGRRIPWMVFFSVLYVVGAAGLWWTAPDGSNMIAMLVMFGIGFIGAEYALIFVNSQLPSVATAEDVGSTSGSGFAFGYLGGLASLAIMLVFFQTMDGGRTIVGLEPALGLDAAQDEDKRIVGPLAAAWYVVFMIPYFLWVRDADTAPKGTGFVGAMALLKKSVANLPNRKSLLAYLGSSMFYRDALNGLYSFGGTYATLVLDWSIVRVGIFGIVSAVAAAAFSWVGGRLDKRYGPKPVIVVAVWILIGVCITIVSMDRTMFFGIPLEEGSALPDMVFFGCGILIGGLGGTLQSASRSLMVRHTDPAVPTESFGLYGLSGRATAFVAPALIGLVTYISESARIGVTPLILLFLVGLILLRWVQAKGDSETWSVS